MKQLLVLLLLVLPTSTFAYETTITRIVDGDTVVADINGVSEKIRIIGINTPESVDPRRPVECFGKEASVQASNLLLNTQVTLENYKERDRHGRVLAYVTMEDNIDFGLQMISEGYAHSFKSYSHKRLASYNIAEKSARKHEVGLWSAEACLSSKETQEILSEERKEFIASLFKLIKTFLELIL